MKGFVLLIVIALGALAMANAESPRPLARPDGTAGVVCIPGTGRVRCFHLFDRVEDWNGRPLVLNFDPQLDLRAGTDEPVPREVALPMSWASIAPDNPGDRNVFLPPGTPIVKLTGEIESSGRGCIRIGVLSRALEQGIDNPETMVLLTGGRGLVFHGALRQSCN